MKIIQDIIKLKKQYHNLESDFTYEGSAEWYKYVLEKQLIKTYYEGGELQGFIEWVRLKEVPKRLEDIELDDSTITTAPVVFVVNAVAKNRTIFNSMVREVKNKNKDFKCAVWHRSSRNHRIKVFKNRRTQDAVI